MPRSNLLTRANTLWSEAENIFEDQLADKLTNKVAGHLVHDEDVTPTLEHHGSSRSVLKAGNQVLGIVAEVSEDESRKLQQKSETRLQKFVHSTAFGSCSAALIFFNGLMIGISTDVKFETMGPEWQIFNAVQEYFFTIAFTLELCFRLGAHGCKYFTEPGVRGWNIFDTVLVLIGLIEFMLLTLENTGLKSLRLMKCMKIMRITRVARLLRLVKTLRPLWAFINGILDAVSIVFWGGVLIFLFVYMSAIFITRQLEADAEVDEDFQKYWGTISRSMFSLFQACTGDGWASALARPVIQRYPLMVIFFVFFILVSQYAIMNVMVAVIVENVVETAFAEDDDQVHTQAEQMLKKMVFDCYVTFAGMDTDCDGMLTKEEFMEGIRQKKNLVQLHKLGISVEDADDLFDLLDADKSGTITLIEFIAGTLKSRGPAKAKDLLLVQCEQHRTFFKLQEVDSRVKTVDSQMRTVLEKLEDIQVSHASILRELRGLKQGPQNLEAPSPPKEDAGSAPWIVAV